MAFTFNGNTPGAITYNGNQVQTLVYNGVVVWEYAVSVTYTCVCSGQKISGDPTFNMTTPSAKPVYTSGTYTYTITIPYKKTTNTEFGNQAYLIPVLKDSNGNVVKEWGNQLVNGTYGVDVRYMVLSWTSNTWLGNAASYSLYIDSTGANKDLVIYPSGYNITLTATNT